MQYFCYISKDRVDSLFESAFDHLVDGIETSQQVEKSKSGEFGIAQLWGLIKAGLTFGHKDSVGSKQSQRKTAVSRLKDVVNYLIHFDQIEIICDSPTEEHFNSKDWLWISSSVSVKNWVPKSPSVTLECKVDEWIIQLACRTSDFSGMYKEEDTFIPTSANSFLFEGKVKIPMGLLMKIVSIDNETKSIYAVPLYIILNPQNKDLGEMNDVAI